MPSPLRERLVELLRAGIVESDSYFELASGEKAKHFLDGKEALGDWDRLEVACRAIVEEVTAHGIVFDAVGGLTLGADALAVGIASVARCKWFFVRKAAKNRGTNRLVEGFHINDRNEVLVVDDVVTTGESILLAYRAIIETGARVVAAVTLADRGELARPKFEQLGVPYFPMTTYESLGIPPVGGPPASRSS